MPNTPHLTDTSQEAHRETHDVGVFVVDDHAGYRVVVEEVVAATSGFTMTGSAGSWRGAYERLRAMSELPKLVLMDVMLDGESGVDAARELRASWPEIKVILVSTLAVEDLPWGARDCGASGLVPKSQLSSRELGRAWHGAYDWAQ